MDNKQYYLSFSSWVGFRCYKRMILVTPIRLTSERILIEYKHESLKFKKNNLEPIGATKKEYRPLQPANGKNEALASELESAYERALKEHESDRKRETAYADRLESKLRYNLKQHETTKS